VSVGLIALLDDIAALAKVAAASLDDIAGQVAQAGTKAAGIVIDDAAVVPRYAAGFAAARELPIIAKIAIDSLRNKLLILLPAALALSFLAPWAVTPLLMIGGAYLCYEGAEKVFEVLSPNRAHAHEARLGAKGVDSQGLEDAQVASAIKTDFILSAEIMAITLATVPEGSLLTRALVLAVVGIGITAAVYGFVALIVKADDIGLALAETRSTSPLGGLVRTLGRGVVRGMPGVLTALSVIGTAAMLWVGGSIVGHGLEEYGISLLGETIQHAAKIAASAASSAAVVVGWMTAALGWGTFGLLFGAALIPVTEFVLIPAWSILAWRQKPS
jgi:predicted DNA repair protein MutK